jgi:hypothetical protein
LTYVVPRSTYGARPEIYAIIRKRLKIPKDVQTVLVDIQRNMDRIHQQITEVASASAEKMSGDLLRDMAHRIAEGVSPDELEGWSAGELSTEQQARIAAGKLAQTELSKAAFAHAKPILEQAAAEASKLLDEELKVEVERNAKFGIPTYEPSEVIRSVNDVMVSLKSAAATPPPERYWPVREMLRGLIEFN